MKCRDCQEFLDNLLFAEPNDVDHAELDQHLKDCLRCARDHASAHEVLACITVSQDVRASHDLKERIMRNC